MGNAKKYDIVSAVFEGKYVKGTVLSVDRYPGLYNAVVTFDDKDKSQVYTFDTAGKQALQTSIFDI